jgi:hypothetical protein
MIIANMWMVASYFSDKPYLNLIGMAWIFLGALIMIGNISLENARFRLDMLQRKLEWQKYDTIVKLLEQIAGKKTIKTKTPIKK